MTVEWHYHRAQNIGRLGFLCSLGALVAFSFHHQHVGQYAQKAFTSLWVVAPLLALLVQFISELFTSKETKARHQPFVLHHCSQPLHNRSLTQPLKR